MTSVIMFPLAYNSHVARGIGSYHNRGKSGAKYRTRNSAKIVHGNSTSGIAHANTCVFELSPFLL